jgi:hypothetical protein
MPDLPPRKRLAIGAYSEEAHLADPTPPAETIKIDIPEPYRTKLYVGKSEDPPDAGWGLFASVPITDKSIICEYAGRIDAPSLLPPSHYVFSVRHRDGSVHTIDAFDPILNRVISYGGFANDPLDEHRENAEWHTVGNRLFLRATRHIKAHEQIFVHYGAAYWADDSYGLPLMIKDVERYLSKVDLAHPIWYHLRLAPLLWQYLYGPTPFPASPSPTATPDNPFPLVPALPTPLRQRSLKNLLDAMRSDGSLPLGEVLPSDTSIASYYRKRGIDNSLTKTHDDSPLLSSGIASSRRAVILATDIAGVPAMEEEEPQEWTHLSPMSPVVDMSAYDLLDLPPLPVSEMYSEHSPPGALASTTFTTSTPAKLASTKPQPDCTYFPIFYKRVNNS